jgi:hypothetical protein
MQTTAGVALRPSGALRLSMRGFQFAGSTQAFAIGQGSAIQQPLALAIIAGLVIQFPMVLLEMPVLIGLTFKKSGRGKSLAIPPWAYSDEPTGQFSSFIGEYFANSIREDGLFAIANGGLVFARGSEGTLDINRANSASGTLRLIRSGRAV